MFMNCAHGRSAKSSWPKTLRERASFDLSCSAEQLNLTPLQKLPGCFGGPCLKVAGVSGCDKKATYLFVAELNQWVMNSAEK